MPNRARTIKEEVRKLGQRKRPLTYTKIAETIRARHPEAQTSEKTVQWYASQLRRQGEMVKVQLSGGRERRDWASRPDEKPTDS